MRVVDANVLIYAVNEDALNHAASRSWLEAALNGADRVGLTWVALLAFVRITTKRELFARPLEVSEAVEQVRTWIAAPGAELLQPGVAHAAYLGEALDSVRVGGNLVMDAHLAALARENRASVVSYDSDFDRFPGIRRYRPEDLGG